MKNNVNIKESILVVTNDSDWESEREGETEREGEK